MNLFLKPYEKKNQFLSLFHFLFQLVTTNEDLEVKIKHINDASEDEIAIGLREDINILRSSTEQLESEKKALLERNQALQRE